MDDSFSLLGLDRELCKRISEESTEELEIKHFVFEDLLDTQERLVCRRYRLSENFEVFVYIMKKTSRSIFSSKHSEKLLGCCLGYLSGSPFSFEDLNFKIQSLEEFSLTVEAAEVTTGKSFYFELCNLCELPEKAPQEVKILLTLYAPTVAKLPPLSHLNQLAEENREILKLAIKGNEKAVEKLERELGEEESKRLLKEFSSVPHRLFDTCIFQSTNGYTIIGVVTSSKEIEFLGNKATLINMIAEDMNFTVLTPRHEKITDGERLEVEGKLFGVAVSKPSGGF